MITYAFANSILNVITGRTSSLTNSGTIYVGLSSTEPTRAAGNVTEPVGSTGYARVVLGSTSQSLSQLMGAAVDGETKNDKIIFFPEALEAYPDNITHFLIFNGTTLIAYGELDAPIKPLKNTVPLVRENELVITIE